jgi:hypothetical protein
LAIISTLAGQRRRERGATQPPLPEPPARGAPRQQREQAERAAAPHGGQRVLAGLLDEHAERAQQQAAGRHQRDAAPFVGRGDRTGCCGGRARQRCEVRAHANALCTGRNDSTSAIL